MTHRSRPPAAGASRGRSRVGFLARRAAFALACAACSEGDVRVEGLHQPPSALMGAGSDDAPLLVPIEPVLLEHELAAAPGLVCDQDGCTSVPRSVWSSVPQEELERRDRELPAEEFAIAQEMQRLEAERETQAVLARATRLVEAGTPDATLDVAVYATDEFFEFGRLRVARRSASEFDRLWAERGAQLEPSQTALRQSIERLGGTVRAELQLANVIYARVPAREIERLARGEGVRGLALGTPLIAAANGLERRLALGLNADGLQSWGWDGRHGSTRSDGERVRFAVIEPGPFNLEHASFWDTAEGHSRVVRTLACIAGSCVDVHVPTTEPEHGTWVASVLLSDFEDHQAETSWSIERRQTYGGIAPEAELLYYIAPRTADAAVAIDHAVGNGADIINMSVLSNGDACANDSLAGVREAVQAAENAGVLVVSVAGNDGDESQGCSIDSFGAYPDTLTVGGIDDVHDLESLASVPLWYASGRNTSEDSVELAGGARGHMRMVDLVTTAYVDRVANGGLTGGTSVAGTSFAAPQVAGAAGLLKSWAHAMGGIMATWSRSPYALRVMLAAMGDGASGPDGGGPGARTTLDPALGFGHLRFNVPSFLGNPDVAHWYLQAYTARQGDVYEFAVGHDDGPEPASLNGWKLAALIDYDWYAGAPDVGFQLIDKCPREGGEQLLILEAAKTAHKARLRLREQDMAELYHGRCLWVRVNVHAARGSFPLYIMDYSYTNSRLDHDM